MENYLFKGEKLPPEITKQINDKQLKNLDEAVYLNFPDGSPEARRYAMQIRLVKKLNKKEYEEAIKTKRKNSRFL